MFNSSALSTMAAICAAGCGVRPAVPSAFNNGCTDLLRQFGANFFILIKCDYQFTDITDTAEWTTAIAADDIHVSPPGALIGNPPSNPVVVIEGCQREVVGVNEYTWGFSTYQTGAVLNNVPLDVAYWCELVGNSVSYRVMFLDCSGILWVDDGWMAAAETAAGTPPVTVSGANPGFAFSMSAMPTWVEGDALSRPVVNRI